MTFNRGLPREPCQAMERDSAQQIAELERDMKKLQEAVAALQAALLLHQIVTHAVLEQHRTSRARVPKRKRK